MAEQQLPPGLRQPELYAVFRHPKPLSLVRKVGMIGELAAQGNPKRTQAPPGLEQPAADRVQHQAVRERQQKQRQPQRKRQEQWKTQRHRQWWRPEQPALPAAEVYMEADVEMGQEGHGEALSRWTAAAQPATTKEGSERELTEVAAR